MKSKKRDVERKALKLIYDAGEEGRARPDKALDER